MKNRTICRAIALGITAAAFASASFFNSATLPEKQELLSKVETVETPDSFANNPGSICLKTLFSASEAVAEEEAKNIRGDNAGSEKPSPIEAAGWGRIKGVELTAPIASLTVEKLLSISLGSMHEDIVRDGLPWFDAVRDDFKNKPRRHRGLDFYGEDLPIIAMAEGAVTVRSNAKNAGYYVVIDHGGGVETLYMHLKEAYRGPNRVRRGDLLGTTGISGNAISPQLHLGIKVDKTYINPITPLKEAADADTRDLITYYESLFDVKSRARKHLVAAYLAGDIEVKKIETERVLELLRTISYDERVSKWLEIFGGK